MQVPSRHQQASVTDGSGFGLVIPWPGTLIHLPLQALVAGASSHVDPGVRKTCIQALGVLVTQWLSPVGDGAAWEAFPGFRRWAIEHVAGEACLRGILQGGLDLQVQRAALGRSALGNLRRWVCLRSLVDFAFPGCGRFVSPRRSGVCSRRGHPVLRGRVHCIAASNRMAPTNHGRACRGSARLQGALLRHRHLRAPCAR